jgi:probable phosphoglycerate mutase
MHHFYFIRHAQTEANLAQIMCGGGVDTPLTPLGIEQAHKAQDIFLSHHITTPAEAIIHSDMKRTRKTAQIINQNIHLPTFSDPNIKEHIVGDWEGKSWTDILESYTQFADPPNGETFADFKTRVRMGIDTALNNHTIPLIVAHGGVWRAFLHSYAIIPTMHPNNAELYFFEHANQNNPFAWHIYHCSDNGIKTKIIV